MKKLILFCSLPVFLLAAAGFSGKNTSSGRENSGQARFSVSDPLGININDIADLNKMQSQSLLGLGFLDITQPPYSADPTGKKDATKAIADAIFFGRHHKLAIYFPAGDYLVSGTIPCYGGWSDERTSNHQYLPWVETWPCVLIGDRRTGKKPRILLAPHSPGFDDPENPKPVFKFNARTVIRKNLTDSLNPDEGSTSYQQLFYGLEVKIGKGNPGAAVLTFNAAEGSTLQDCTFDVGDGFTGVLGGPGSGGAIYNVEVKGGAIGMQLLSSRPTCTVTGCRFSGQRVAGIHYGQRGPLILVGCEFRMNPDVPAIRVRSRLKEYLNTSGEVLAGSTVGVIAEPNGSASLIDCRIEYKHSGSGVKPAILAEASVYARNTWFYGVNRLIESSEGIVEAPELKKWTQVVEMAVINKDYSAPMSTSVYVDGQKKSDGITKELKTFRTAPANLRMNHIWDENNFPYWDAADVVNVKGAPYYAKGDGITDDTEAIQKAIDENEKVFFPKGAYRITKTLRIKSGKKICGISPIYSIIVPVAAKGGDFNKPENPNPVLQIEDTPGTGAVVAFLGVFMAREQDRSCYMMDIAGSNCIVRCTLPISNSTVADIEPLEKGIYPWTNWKWEDMESFALYTGFLKHYWVENYWDDEGNAFVGPDSSEGGIPNWPLVRVHGNGSGRWYLFVDLDFRMHGKNHRRMLIKNTKGPFSVYGLMLQYGSGMSEMEVTGAENVSIYGVKNERPAIAVWIKNSRHVLVAGLGGPVMLSRTRGKIVVENSSDITLTSLTPDFNSPKRPMMRSPFVVLKHGNESLATDAYDRPILYKVKDTVKYGDANTADPATRIPDCAKSAFDSWMRDTWVTPGPDGFYYMTGSTADPNRKFKNEPHCWDWNDGVYVWRSKDMKQWQPMGLVWSIAKDGTWQKHPKIYGEGEKYMKASVNGDSLDNRFCAVWAPELHYIKSAKNWFIVACMNQSVSGKGSFILKSATGRPEGPYVNIPGNGDKPLFGNIDGSLFEDTDGTVYFVGHNRFIARMKPDMSGLAEDIKVLKETRYNPEPYIEGVFIFKYENKYHLVQAIWSHRMNDGTDTYAPPKKANSDQTRYSYDCVIATSDSVYGPYSERYNAITGGGHNDFFRDKQGRCWATMFYNPRGAQAAEFKQTCRPALIPMKYENGRFMPDQDRCK